MLMFFRYLLGFLLIEIKGDCCEKILNVAAFNNIIIWNTYYKNGNIYGCITAKNFLKLYKLRHETKCRIKIVKKAGLYFNLKNYKKRFGFFVGFIAFFLILFILSNYIWIINFNGNLNISTQELICACENIGIKEGMKRSKLNNKYDAQKLQLDQDNIAWCSINIEGCTLSINISETKASDKDKRQIPTNIKSSVSGKIKKIDVISGDVYVKIGDYVSGGDLLVSGIIQNNSGLHFVHSEGEIIAETERVFSASGDFNQMLLTPTNKIISQHTINFFNLKIPLYLRKVNCKYNYEITTNKLTLFNKRIPIVTETQKYNILKSEYVLYNQQTLEKILQDEINEQIKNFNFITIQEKKREIIKTDKGILLKIVYACEENIARQDEILISKEN